MTLFTDAFIPKPAKLSAEVPQFLPLIYIYIYITDFAYREDKTTNLPD